MTETSKHETGNPETGPATETAPADAAARVDAPDEVDADAELAGEEEASADVEALEAELALQKERMLRALADVENMRRRHERELEDARKYAATSLARELLDVADNLSRALASLPDTEGESEVVRNLVEGVGMTEKMLLAAFERHRIVKLMPEKGERFDHSRHQAMFEVPTTELAPGTVAEVMQPGYTIADRLLRPALVGVAKAPPKPELMADDDEGEPRRGEQVDTTA